MDFQRLFYINHEFENQTFDWVRLIFFLFGEFDFVRLPNSIELNPPIEFDWNLVRLGSIYYSGDGLKAICHIFAHSTNLSRSDWGVIASSELCTRPYNRLSPANNFIFEVISLPISLTNNTKHKGPNTVPCGTPDLTQDFSLDSPSRTTCWVLPISHAFIQANIKPPMP